MMTQDLQRRLAKHNEEETKRAPAVAARSRLLVVSNRLPVTVRRDEESGEWTFAVSSGGTSRRCVGTWMYRTLPCAHFRSPHSTPCASGVAVWPCGGVAVLARLGVRTCTYPVTAALHLGRLAG